MENVKIFAGSVLQEFCKRTLVCGPTGELVVVPVEYDLPLGVAHPVQDVEGGEAQGEHQSGDSVDPEKRDECCSDSILTTLMRS